MGVLKRSAILGCTKYKLCGIIIIAIVIVIRKNLGSSTGGLAFAAY